MTGPVAGWYPDPEHSGQDRWWDGTQWSDARRPSAATEPTQAMPAAAPTGPPPTTAMPVVPTGPPPAGPQQGPSSAGNPATRWLLAALGVVLLAGAVLGAILLFGGDDEEPTVASGSITSSSSTSSTSTSTSTTEATTTTTEATTTTTEKPKPTTTTTEKPKPTTTTTAPPPPPPPPPSSSLGEYPLFSDTGASGSGCVPGDGSLPGGWWYGRAVTSVQPGNSFDFDLACFYVGQAAQDEAAENGDSAGDVYITNNNPTLRAVTLASDATMRCVNFDSPDGEGDCQPGTIPREYGIWVRIDGGTATRIVEQFTP